MQSIGLAFMQSIGLALSVIFHIVVSAQFQITVLVRFGLVWFLLVTVSLITCLASESFVMSYS